MSREAGIAAATTEPDKRRRADDDCDATIASSLIALSDDVLLHALAFADAHEVVSAAGACRRWHGVVHGEDSASLWRGFVEELHPNLLEAGSGAARTPSAGWRALFLRTERLVTLVLSRLFEGLDSFEESIRNGRELYGESDRRDAPYATTPATGTTATVSPDDQGAFSEPVYYDWDANWDRVFSLVPTEHIQAALKRCIDLVSDDCYFDSWNEATIRPFLFMDARCNEIGEQKALMKNLLPRAFVREMNGRVAKWFAEEGEELLLWEQYSPVCIAEAWVAKELDSGVAIGEDEIDEEMEEIIVDMINDLYHMIHEDEDGRDLMHKITTTAEAVASYAFLPLNYALAELLSPEDADLKIYASEEYSVVVDKRRNIVFGNLWYFLGHSASFALESARDRPQINQYTYKTLC